MVGDSSLKSVKTKWLLLCILLILGDFSLISNSYASNDEISVGVFPRRNASLSHKLYKPMMKYLSGKLGRPVKLITPKNFKMFWKGVKNKKYDVVHFNQYHYVVSHKKLGYDVILKNEEFGKSTIAGTVVVRKDSGINSATDLKNRTVVFGGGPKAMQSYIVARYLLEKNGLVHGSYKEKFSSIPPHAIYAAYRHQAAAAGSGDLVFNQPVIKEHVKVNELKFLYKGPELAHLPWAVKDDMPVQLRNQIQSLLAGLKMDEEGRNLLSNAAMTGFVRAEDKDYNEHRNIIHAVFGEQY